MGADPEESSLLKNLVHLETIKKLIECPVCFEIPLPPVLLCNQGHIICNNCKRRTQVCPLCRSNYSTARNFLAETIIENSVLPCKYSEHGCPVSIRGSKLSDHMKLCNYRPVICNDCGGTLISSNEYEAHLLNTHAIDRIVGKWNMHNGENYVTYDMNLNMANRTQLEINVFRKQIYLQAEKRVNFLLRFFTKNGQMCVWVSSIGQMGLDSERWKYKASIECHKMGDDSVIHLWQGPVNDVRADPVNEIYQQGFMLSIPIILPFEWHYYIEIWQEQETLVGSANGANT